MSREAPAIVQRPKSFDAMFFDEMKKQRQINITVVKIMKMNDVRLDFFELRQKRQGREEGKATIKTGKLCEI